MDEGFLGKHTRLYEDMVDQLRRKGWSRIEAESEALDRIEILREREKTTAATPYPAPR